MLKVDSTPRTAWTIASMAAALVVLVPVAVILSSVFRDSDGVWQHLEATRLGDYALNTLVLSLGVCCTAGVVGVVSAWVVTMYRFPGRLVLSWALLLPLAVPPYLAAYAMTDLLQFSGPVQGWMRNTFGLTGGDYWFPDLRTLGGATFILSFSLFPYVYFAARIAFLEQSRSMLEASRTLGCGPLRTFLLVGVPLARPAIAGGVALVLMETVADFGAVDYCAVDTFATGVYRTWYGLDSPVAAGQLSALVVSILFLFVGLEWLLRRSGDRHRATDRANGSDGVRIGRPGRALAILCCLVPLTSGFLLPAGRLAYLAFVGGDGRSSELLGGLVVSTASIAVLASVVAMMLGILIVYGRRLQRNPWTACAALASRMGYAMPGPVIAIGLLICLGWIDHRINDLAAAGGGSWRPGLLLTGSIAALVIGYQARFLAIAVSFVESGLARVHRSIDAAARTLGAGPSRTLFGVHLPMLRTSLLAGGLIVFVDVAKELPITLMLRPFNFDTLAVRVYQLASDERIEEAASAAIAIIGVGLIPVLLLARHVERIRTAGSKGATA